MVKEQPKSNTSHSLFTRTIITLPIVAYIISNEIIGRHYGFHSNYFYSFIYSALYYGIDISKTLMQAYVIFLFSFILPFGLLLGNKTISTKYGSAKLATTSLIKKMGLFSHEGIILGKFKGEYLRYDKPLCSLVMAPAGTGKTVSIAITNILTLNTHSLVIHDPKGELTKLTAKFRNTFTKTVVFNFAKKNSAVFNPFCASLLPEDELDWQSYVDNIATILFPTEKQDADYWTTEARNFFSLMALWELYNKRQSSFYEIYSTSKNADKVPKALRKIVAEIEKKGIGRAKGENEEEEEEVSGWEELKNDSEDTPKGKIEPDYTALEGKILLLARGVLQISSSANQLAGVLGSFNSRMSIFTEDKIINATTGKNMLPLREMRKSLYTVYLIVEENDRERLRPIVTLLLEVLAKDLISEEPIKTDNRITFILDEFTRLKGISTVKTLPEISRSYNISTIYIAQDFAQITMVFGKELIDIFKSLAAYKIIFPQNNNDTANDISRMIGNETIERISTSSNDSDKRENISKSEEGLNLVSAQDIMNLGEDHIYIIVEKYSKFPIKAEASKFFNDKTLTALVDKNKLNSYEEVVEEIDQ